MKVVFSIGDAISLAWSKVKEQLIFFVGFVGIVIAIQLIVQIAFKFLELYVHHLLFLPITLVLIVVSLIISLTLTLWQICIALTVVDNAKASYKDLKKVLPLLGKGIITHVLYGIIVCVGFLLLIVPGFIWAIKYQYALYFIVDKGMSPFEALEASGRLTMDTKWQLAFFGFTLGLINVLGFIALGVGILISIPITMIAPAYVYRWLQKDKDTRIKA